MYSKKDLTFVILTITVIIISLLLNNYLWLIIVGIYGTYLLICNLKNRKTKIKDKLFNSLIENLDTIYIMINDDNKVMYISNNVEEILGIDRKMKTDEQIVSDIFNIPIIKSELKNYTMDKTYISQMIKYDHRKYNCEMWIKIKIFPYKDKNVNYKIIQIIDATKEHDRQHLLINQASSIKSRENQLIQITSASYDMELDINLIDDTYTLKYFKANDKYFGEQKQGKYTEFFNELIEKYINVHDKEEFIKVFEIDNFKKHFSRYEFNSLVVRYRVGNEVRNNVWLESTIFFLMDKGNNKVSILTKNVTEDAEGIRKQNILLQNALNDAKMADKAKTELISTISHDIRTPLTNIIGLSDSLLNINSNNDIKEDIKNIKDSSKEVLNIIDGLLDTSKLEKKFVEKEEENYSIFKMFNNIETSVKDYATNKNLELNISINNNLPVILYGDYKRITQAITEVINNSIKYTNDGKIDVNVKGEKKNSNVDLIIEVADTGIGISETKLDAIMNSVENKGIDTVKKITKLLDGKFEIESKIDEYTKVTLTFTQKIVEDNKIREMIETNKNIVLSDFSDKKILVIDDNNLNLKVTNRLLEPYKADVTLIESGIEALDLIKENNVFDLILIDQMMPVMDGRTTLNNLKKIENFNTPVVALTADAIKGKREDYIKDGFDDYISKPIEKKELNRVLNRFLKKS